MKIVALAIVLVLCAAPAGATTLEVTSGFVVATQFSTFDVGYEFIGADFHFFGSNPTAFDPFDLDIGISGTFLADTLFTTDPPDFSTIWLGDVAGTITFAHGPITLWEDGPPGSVIQAFTMTGALTGTDPLTDETRAYDLVGQGVMSAFWRPEGIAHEFIVTYTFMVPEPATWLLVVVGGVLLLRHRNASS